MLDYDWLREITELEAAGWGDVPRDKIPHNWREMPRKRQISPLSGRKKIMRPCPKCRVRFGAREMRDHMKECRVR